MASPSKRPLLDDSSQEGTTPGTTPNLGPTDLAPNNSLDVTGRTSNLGTNSSKSDSLPAPVGTGGHDVNTGPGGNIGGSGVANPLLSPSDANSFGTATPSNVNVMANTPDTTAGQFRRKSSLSTSGDQRRRSADDIKSSSLPPPHLAPDALCNSTSSIHGAAGGLPRGGMAMSRTLAPDEVAGKQHTPPSPLSAAEAQSKGVSTIFGGNAEDAPQLNIPQSEVPSLSVGKVPVVEEEGTSGDDSDDDDDEDGFQKLDGRTPSMAANAAKNRDAKTSTGEEEKPLPGAGANNTELLGRMSSLNFASFEASGYLAEGAGNDAEERGFEQDEEIDTTLKVPLRDKLYFLFDGVPWALASMDDLKPFVRPSKWIVNLTMIMVLISCISFSVETLPQFYFNPPIALEIIEIICVAWFTIDLLVRGATVRDRLAFVTSVMNWIDFLSIIPFYISLFAGSSENNSSRILVMIRILRLVRAIRVFKLSKHSKGLQTVTEALRRSTGALSLLGFLLFVLLLIFSSIFYFTEQIEQTWNEERKVWIRDADDTVSPYQSIFHSMWFSVVTITTVGYGDDYPYHPVTKIAAVGLMLTAAFVIAFPTVVLSANFHDVHSEQNLSDVQMRREFHKTALMKGTMAMDKKERVKQRALEKSDRQYQSTIGVFAFLAENARREEEEMARKEAEFMRKLEEEEEAASRAASQKSTSPGQDGLRHSSPDSNSLGQPSSSPVGPPGRPELSILAPDGEPARPDQQPGGNNPSQLGESFASSNLGGSTLNRTSNSAGLGATARSGNSGSSAVRIEAEKKKQKPTRQQLISIIRDSSAVQKSHKTIQYSLGRKAPSRDVYIFPESKSALYAPLLLFYCGKRGGDVPYGSTSSSRARVSIRHNFPDGFTASFTLLLHSRIAQEKATEAVEGHRGGIYKDFTVEAAKLKKLSILIQSSHALLHHAQITTPQFEEPYGSIPVELFVPKLDALPVLLKYSASITFTFVVEYATGQSHTVVAEGLPGLSVIESASRDGAARQSMRLPPGETAPGGGPAQSRLVAAPSFFANTKGQVVTNTTSGTFNNSGISPDATPEQGGLQAGEKRKSRHFLFALTTDPTETPAAVTANA